MPDTAAGFLLRNGTNTATPAHQGRMVWGTVPAHLRATLAAELGGRSGRGALAQDLETTPSKGAGGSPGNLVLLTFVFLETPRSPWPPRGHGPHVWTLALVHLCSLLYISVPKKVACSSIPRLAHGRDSGFRWNPLHPSLLSRTPLCRLPDFPGCCRLRCLSVLSCRTVVLMCFWSPHGRFMSPLTLE